MARKEDETDGGERSGRLAEIHLAALETVVADCVQALVETRLEPGDLVSIERKARSVGVLARAIKLVDGLRARPRKPRIEAQETTEFSEDATGHGDEMDPAEVAALRAELGARLHRLRTFVDRKRVAGEPDRTRAEGPDPPDAAAA